MVRVLVRVVVVHSVETTKAPSCGSSDGTCTSSDMDGDNVLEAPGERVGNQTGKGSTAVGDVVGAEVVGEPDDEVVGSEMVGDEVGDALGPWEQTSLTEIRGANDRFKLN